MKWQDAYDARPSKNIRGENVFDIFRKGTQEAIWVDIPEQELEKFMAGMVSIAERAITEELDEMLSVTEPKEVSQDNRPMTIPYDRLRQYDGTFGGATFEEVLGSPTKEDNE